MATALMLLDATSYTLALLLVALGLAIVFGLMGVINMAHGELFLLGAYTVLLCHRLGLGAGTGMLLAPFVVGAVGLVIEELVVRHVYRRPLDTILATWGVAIILRQAIVLGFGPASHAVPAPLDASLDLAGNAYPAWRLAVMAVAAIAVAATLLLIHRTRLGLLTRGAVADRTMAACLGLPVRNLDRWTFAGGAALAGLAGAVMAPLMSIDPYMGTGYLLPAFLAVLLGGGGLGGTVWGAIAAGGGQATLAALWTPIAAEIAVLAAAALALRLVTPAGARRRRA